MLNQGMCKEHRNRHSIKTILASLVLLTSGVSFSSLASTDLSDSARIISAGAAVTEIVEALGAEKQLVAIDVTSEQPKGEPLPVVGYHRQLSTEGLMALHPTL